jgi:hypothetical protein
MLRPPDGVVTILDVGGDDVGARALASFRTSIADGEYELWLVINAKRPFTSTVDGCLQMMQAVEAASRWRITGLLVNSHLIDETTVETVLDGCRLAEAVRARTGLPIRAVATMERLADAPELSAVGAPILRLERHMRPPWLQPASGRRDAGADSADLPAARPVPLGRPRPISYASPEGERRGQNRH